MGRAIKAGRVWTNCYHQYPAHAAFGGYKSSGVGRENHRMMLEHYSQTKCLLVSYDPNADGVVLEMDRLRAQRRCAAVAATPAALEVIRSPRGRPRAADVLPVGGVLRWHLPDLPQGRRAAGRAPRRALGGHRRSAVLHRLRPVRALGHAPVPDRRLVRRRRGVLARGARGGAFRLSHTVTMGGGYGAPRRPPTYNCLTVADYLEGRTKTWPPHSSPSPRPQRPHPLPTAPRSSMTSAAR